MRVVVFGATGRIGSSVVAELVRRGHRVTAVARSGNGAAPATGVVFVSGDVTDPSNVARVARGHDAVVSAVGPTRGQAASMIPATAAALVTGARRARVTRLLVVGGAGSLITPSGVPLLETPEFPAALKPVAEAHQAALERLRGETDLEWTYVSPPVSLNPSGRTGRYRSGSDGLITDAHGESSISFEDLAVAIVDEVETPRHVRRRFTVASA